MTYPCSHLLYEDTEHHHYPGNPPCAPARSPRVTHSVPVQHCTPVVYSRDFRKWDYTACTLLCLPSFAQHDAGEAYPCCCELQEFPHFHHVYFILLEGHLGCFQFGAIANSTATNRFLVVCVFLKNVLNLKKIKFIGTTLVNPIIFQVYNFVTYHLCTPLCSPPQI